MDAILVVITYEFVFFNVDYRHEYAPYVKEAKCSNEITKVYFTFPEVPNIMN